MGAPFSLFILEKVNGSGILHKNIQTQYFVVFYNFLGKTQINLVFLSKDSIIKNETLYYI